MIIFALAVIGVVLGALGLGVAVHARSRSARIVDEYAEALHHRLALSGGADGHVFRDLAIVHYDALTEMRGGLSFSLALLNAAGDGIVLTSINGRSETRTYAKVIEQGKGYGLLSPEEDQVVRAARLGKGPGVRPEDPVRSAVGRPTLD